MASKSKSETPPGAAAEPAPEAAAEPAPEAAAEPARPLATSAIGVRGPQHGRWRAGRHFGPVETIIPLSSLSEEELQAIEGDPLLKRRLVD